MWEKGENQKKKRKGCTATRGITGEVIYLLLFWRHDWMFTLLMVWYFSSFSFQYSLVPIFIAASLLSLLKVWTISVERKKARSCHFGRWGGLYKFSTSTLSVCLCGFSAFGTDPARSQQGYFKVCVLFLLDAAFKVSCHCQFLRFATFPWMYLLSGIFKDAEMGFIIYVCINLFISVNTILSSSILYFLGQISTRNPEVSINYPRCSRSSSMHN